MSSLLLLLILIFTNSIYFHFISIIFIIFISILYFYLNFLIMYIYNNNFFINFYIMFIYLLLLSLLIFHKSLHQPSNNHLSPKWTIRCKKNRAHPFSPAFLRQRLVCKGFLRLGISYCGPSVEKCFLWTTFSMFLVNVQ